MKAYKIVLLSMGAFISHQAGIAMHYSQATRYGVGVCSVPNNDWGPLAAFDTLINARNFQRKFGSSPFNKLFECDVVLSEKDTLVSVYGIRRDLPKGTICCDSITLLHEIPLKEEQVNIE